MIKSSNKMPRPEQLSKEDMAGFEEDGDEDDLPLPILKRKNVRKLIIYHLFMRIFSILIVIVFSF